MSTARKSAVAAVIAAFLAIVTIAVAAPVKAAAQADLSDVRFMTAMAKVAWMDVSQSARDGVCTWFYISPYEARNELARSFYYDVFDGQYSMYDSKRAAWRVLNWGC